MRKVLPSIISFLTLQISANAQQVWTIDSLMITEKVNLKTQFKCDNTGNKIDTLFQWQYDELGRLIMHINYTGGKKFMTRLFNYNSFSKADSIYTQFKNSDRYLSQVNLFNELGQLIERYNCSQNSGCKLSERYTYSGELMLSKTEIKNDMDDTKFIFQYDNKGNAIEEQTVFKTGYTVKRVSIFNERNLKVKSISYSPDGAKSDSTLYEHDQNGNLTSLDWIGGLNTKSKYLYDEIGNNTEYQSISMNGQIAERRTMDYIGRLVKSRIHFKQNQIDKYYKFEYKMFK